MPVKLSPRLFAVASLVRGGGSLCDVGTDHAYLPIYLLENGRINLAIGADVGEMPLKNAASSVREYNMEERIDLRLSDGLSNILPDEADEIVFAGMGGTLIVSLLMNAPWLKNSRYHLIFQPQSRAEELREYLYSNGFIIGTELSVNEGKRYYIAFDAVYTGEAVKFNKVSCFLGKLPKNECAKIYLKHQLSRIEDKYNAYIVNGENAETDELFQIIKGIKDFIND